LKNALDHGKELERELNRLMEIEERLKQELNTVEDQIEGINKALSYNLVYANTETRYFLNDTLVKNKKKANKFCALLGISNKYETK
jgi:regulator of sirC expression with transglutaminase-like and TPR domain